MFDGVSLSTDFVAKYLENYIKFSIRRGEENLKHVLENCFNDSNTSFGKYMEINHSNNYGTLYENVPISGICGISGTSATVCLLKNNRELTLAHFGNSRAILVRYGRAHILTDRQSDMMRAMVNLDMSFALPDSKTFEVR